MGDRKKVKKKVEKKRRKGRDGIRSRSELTGVGEGIVKGGHGRLQAAGARQHSMGVCDVGPGRCAAVHGAGEGSRAGKAGGAAPGCVQRSRARGLVR